MIEDEYLSTIKNSIVAIGLIEKHNYQRINPFKIFGTGFFINKNGFIITADHVISAAITSYNLRKDKTNTELVALHYSYKKNFTFNLRSIPPTKIFSIRRLTHNVGDVAPVDLDIGLIKSNLKIESPFLEIKEKTDYKLFDEICICGYPSGEQSFDLTKKYAGLRFSPVIQFGRISSFMPIDKIPIPYGIQTDIIGVGGSSGSPLIDYHDRKVIGIAQKVLATHISGQFYPQSIPKDRNTFNEYTIGQNIGLIYGLRIDLFEDLINGLKNNKKLDQFKTDYRISRFVYKQKK